MKLQILDMNSFKFNKNLFIESAHYLGEPFWVPFVRSYFNEINIETVIIPFNKIDKTKNWFINLVVKMHTWENFFGDIIEDLPVEIQNELINGNAYLILNHEHESFTNVFFDLLYRKLKLSKLNPNKIIYMIGASNAKQIYEKFVIENNIKNDQRINLIESCHVFRILSRTSLKHFNYDSTVKKEKKFLSLNRVGRIHRVILVSLLAKKNLLDKGYVSLGLFQNEIDNLLNDLRMLSPNIDYDIFDGFNIIKNKLPLTVDEIDLKTNQFQLSSLPSDFYQKTYFSLVSSTFALKMQEPSLGFTEKEIKPILYKHPFIIWNLPGALNHLRNSGFLTFNKWFDETYDNETDDYERLKKIINEVERLSLIPDHVWDQMLLEMQPILLHNYNVLVNHNREHIFFNSDLKNFLYYLN